MKLSGILHYLGILGLFVLSMVGGFFWGGDSLAVLFAGSSLVLAVVIFFLVKLMVQKKKETHPNYLHVAILWALYLSIAVIGGLFSLHGITVQFIAQDDLRNNGNEKLQSTINMIKEFDSSVKSTRNKLHFNIKSSLEKYDDLKSEEKVALRDELSNTYNLPDDVLDDRNLGTNTSTHADNWISSNYTKQIEGLRDKIASKLEVYYKENKDVFNNIDVLKTNTIYYELDTIIPNNKERLETRFNSVVDKYNLTDKAFNNFTIPTSNVPINSLTDLRNQYKPFLYISIYLILHLFILYPFLLSVRVGKKPLAEEDTTDNI